MATWADIQSITSTLPEPFDNEGVLEGANQYRDVPGVGRVEFVYKGPGQWNAYVNNGDTLTALKPGPGGEIATSEESNKSGSFFGDMFKHASNLATDPGVLLAVAPPLVGQYMAGQTALSGGAGAESAAGLSAFGEEAMMSTLGGQASALTSPALTTAGLTAAGKAAIDASAAGTLTGLTGAAGPAATTAATTAEKTAASGTALSKLAEMTGLSEGALKLLGIGAGGLVDYFGEKDKAENLRQIADDARGAEQARYDDLVRREQERYEDTKATAEGRYQDLTAKELERFNLLRGREDVAIGRRDDAIQFGRDVGQPSRDRYEGSFAPGFTMENDPGYSDALAQTARASTNALSTGFGNPGNSPNAWKQSLTDLYQSTAYPALQNYRTQNANTGFSGPYAGAGATVPSIGSGLPGFGQPSVGIPTGNSGAGSGVGTGAGTNTSLAAVGAQNNIYGSVGETIGKLTTPTQSLADILKKLNQGNNIFDYRP